MNLVDLQKEIDAKRKKTEEQETEEKFLDSVKKHNDKIEADIASENKKEKFVYTPRIVSFDIIYELHGEKKQCKLSSKIMDAEARAKYDRLMAAMTPGIAFEQLPAESQNRYAALARIMSQSIDCPEWLLTTASEDLEFAYSVAYKLIEHEQRFFRNSSVDGKKTKEKPRFSIDTTSY